MPQQVESEYETSGMEMDSVQASSEDKDDIRGTTEAAVCGDDVCGYGVREGVLKQCGDLVLVATGQPLCIPISQVSH